MANRSATISSPSNAASATYPRSPIFIHISAASNTSSWWRNCATFPPTRRTSRIEGLLRMLGLWDDRHVPMSSYSKGMRQKVLLSAALLHNPDLILLDEPFSGLDVGASLVLRSLIEELAARGKVILFSSHELDTVERVSRHVVILHRGKVVADDSIDGLRGLMSLPTLEEIFRQLAVEQNTAQIAAEIANLIEA
ncbi:MAG TPA: ABC transporter ATP-binding protein [Bryobacteraceae bacterium]|nr:ABC transporter ATP-binding protein [Bryobacteraceae bacterium]